MQIQHLSLLWHRYHKWRNNRNFDNELNQLLTSSKKKSLIFYSSKNFGKLANESTELYKKTWQEICKMLKAELKKWNTMKKTAIILYVIAFITSSCIQTTKKQNEPNKSENADFLENKEDLHSCDDFGNRQNPLYGKVYRDIADVLGLKYGNESWGSRVIDASKNENGDYRFGINFFTDDNEKNIICVFDEIIDNENGKPNYKILDTINIGKLKDNEYFVFDCEQNHTIWDTEIFAVVIVENDNEFFDNEFFDKIVKAWRADTKTGKIKPIKNLKGLIGINDSYGI